jgi:hypothetical protein
MVVSHQNFASSVLYLGSLVVLYLHQDRTSTAYVLLNEYWRRPGEVRQNHVLSRSLYMQ